MNKEELRLKKALLLAQLEDIESELNAVSYWEPKGGEWFINQCDDEVEYWKMSTEATKLAGLERQTKEQAERAAVEMRRFNRLLALRDELCSGQMNWEDKNSKKYYVYFDNSTERWDWAFDGFLQKIAPYFTTQQSVERACLMLNSGEVKL
jgi:hypothetical protein